MNRSAKNMLRLIGMAFVGICGLVAFAWYSMPIRGYLPSDRQARVVFDQRRTSFDRAAEVLQKEKCVGVIASDGTSSNPMCSIPVAIRRALVQETGAKTIVLGDDGSMEFALWGTGCAICSDSYKGFLYLPTGARPGQVRGWVPAFAISLEDDALPKANGKVSDGLYLLPIDSEWAIFRIKYGE